MPSSPSGYSGRCACGAITLTFWASVPAHELPVRACSCSFCSRHRARCVTDPNGRVELSGSTDMLTRYRFGLNTADFLVCRGCGVYLGAVFEEGGATFATLNIANLEARASFGPAQPVDYGAETAEERRARCRARWTLATIVIHDSNATQRS